MWCGTHPELLIDGEHCSQGGQGTALGTPENHEDIDTVNDGEEGILFSITFRIALL